jgi:hypothetical protein
MQPRAELGGARYTAPYRSFQPTFDDTSASGTGWPTFAPGAGFTPGQTTWPAFSPSVGLTNALALMRNAAGLGSKFAPLLPQEARDDSGPSMPQSAGWLSQSIPSQSPSGPAVVPVAYQDSTKVRPGWARQAYSIPGQNSSSRGCKGSFIQSAPTQKRGQGDSPTPITATPDLTRKKRVAVSCFLSRSMSGGGMPARSEPKRGVANVSQTAASQIPANHLS